SARPYSLDTGCLLLAVAILCAVNVELVQGGRRHRRWGPPPPIGRNGVGMGGPDCPNCGGLNGGEKYPVTSTAVDERKNSASTTVFSDQLH
uniref:Uncharacterized protein n=1 Tax=Aegilops tauschii subsp. strangulata TaxID=200361 RepID=A0A452XL49_AEGTS